MASTAGMSIFHEPGTGRGSWCAHVTLLLAELRSRWDKGERVSAREYLDRHPELEQDEDAVLDLGYEEYCQRVERGESVVIADFVGQFPRHALALERLIASHTGAAKVASEEKEIWPEAGDDLAGYRLIRELGRGSFSRVFYATETALGNRPVVVKVSKRLGSEPSILGQIVHPNIVTVHSLREEPKIGKSVMCMPYLGKATLNSLLQSAFATRELPQSAEVITKATRLADWEPINGSASRPSSSHASYIDGVLDLTIQMADALSFVHGRGVFHRDLKPSNVLLTADGRAMLLDFNLSVGEQEKSESLGGTLGYMPPEMLQTILGENTETPSLLDARSDIFSLGVILYELLAGVHPFGPLPRGGDLRLARHLRRHHAAGPSKLQFANPAVSAALAGIVERCLAANPEDRFGSAHEFATALRRCGSRSTRFKAGVRRHRRLLVSSAIAAGIGAILLSAVLIVREPAARRHYKDGVEAFRTGQYVSAIENFHRALPGSENPAAVHFARGWAYLQNGAPKKALEDFEQADKLAGNGRTKASIAEAMARSESPSATGVAHWYEQAIKANYETAPLLNNLGAWYYKLPLTRSKSEAVLKKALERDPNLQAAYHNLLILELDRCLREAKTDMKAGLEAAKKALAAGEQNAHLYYDAACMFALAAKQDATLTDEAFRLAAKAIENGFDVQRVRTEPFLRGLSQHEHFAKLMETPCLRKAARPNQLVALAIPLE